MDENMYYFPQLCCICESRNCQLMNISTTNDGELKLIDKLKQCVPEIIPMISPCTTLMCQSCCKRLDLVYQFKTSCIKTHQLLNYYANQLNLNEKNKISQLNINLVKQIKNEPGNIIENSTNENTEELYTVYRVEVIKELSDETEENDFVEQNCVQYLKQDLTTLAAEISNISSPDNHDSDHYDENDIIQQENEENYTISAEISNVSSPNMHYLEDYDEQPDFDEDNDVFFGFNKIEIKKSKQIFEKTKRNIRTVTHKNSNFILLRSLNIINGENYKFCKICNKTFTRPENFKKHVLLHENDTPYVCIICMKPLRYKATLKNHMKVHIKISKQLSCDLCNSKFAKSSQLYYHKMVHHRQSIHICQICDRYFHSKPSLDMHLNTHIPTHSVYTCAICNRPFNSKYNLRRHVVLHNQARRPFKCNMCPKAFTLKQYLKSHLDFHYDIKRFKCTLCEKFFTRKTSLKEHLEGHKKKIHYKCSVCDKTFVMLKLLKKHHREHRNDFPYGCIICSKNFKYAAQLNHHVTNHLLD